MREGKEMGLHTVKPQAQRMRALLSGERVDRVPLFSAHMTGFCARNLGYPLAAAYSDVEKSFWSQVWTQEQYGFEAIPVYSYASYGAWEFGGELKLPSSEWDQAPSVLRYPVQSEADIDRIEQQGLADVKERGSIPLGMEFSRLQQKHGMPIVFPCGTPFPRAANVCGIENFLRWLVKKPELAHRLLRLMTHHLLEAAKYWVDTFGPENLIPYAGNPTESNQLISPRQFERFALPYTKELYDKVLAMGVKHFLFHICGEQNLNLPLLAQIPRGNPDIASFGHEVELRTAIKYFGETCVIVGNIEPSLIQTASPSRIYEVSVQCIEEAKNAPRGFMLSAGCELPPNAPPYNVYVMKKAIDDFGG